MSCDDDDDSDSDYIMGSPSVFLTHSSTGAGSSKVQGKTKSKTSNMSKKRAAAAKRSSKLFEGLAKAEVETARARVDEEQMRQKEITKRVLAKQAADATYRAKERAEERKHQKEMMKMHLEVQKQQMEMMMHLVASIKGGPPNSVAGL